MKKWETERGLWVHLNLNTSGARARSAVAVKDKKLVAKPEQRKCGHGWFASAQAELAISTAVPSVAAPLWQVRSSVCPSVRECQCDNRAENAVTAELQLLLALQEWRIQGLQPEHQAAQQVCAGRAATV